MESRIYYDCISEEKIHFYSNASQKLIDSLDFNGDWCIVNQILINAGYKVIESANEN